MANDPFLATYIGAGYYYYDAPLPPNITYGTARYQKKGFPDCGETSLWNFFNTVLWNKDKMRFNVEILKTIAANVKTSPESPKIDIDLTEDDLKLKLPDPS